MDPNQTSPMSFSEKPLLFEEYVFKNKIQLTRRSWEKKKKIEMKEQEKPHTYGNLLTRVEPRPLARSPSGGSSRTAECGGGNASVHSG